MVTESSKRNITMNEALAQAYVFFLAGFESASSIVTHCLFELSRECNREIQEKTAEDIKTVLQKYNGEVTYESIQEMAYLHKVINGKNYVFSNSKPSVILVISVLFLLQKL